MISTNSRLFPLNTFSEFIVHRLPEIHQERQPELLIHKGLRLLPSINQIIELCYNANYEERVRALGDLGMYLSAALRQQVCTPDIQHHVLACTKLLASSTGLVPRDCFPSYFTYNDPDALRTFTGEATEKHFIVQVQRSHLALRTSIEDLLLLQQHPEHDQRINILQETIRSLQEFVEENQKVYKLMNPELFAREVFPYYVVIEDNRTILAPPGGQHEPALMLVDLITGTADSHYMQQTQSALKYVELYYRTRIQTAMQWPSLRTHYEQQDPYAQEHELLQRIYHILLNYRKAHLGMIQYFIGSRPPYKENQEPLPSIRFMNNRIHMTEKKLES